MDVHIVSDLNVKSTSLRAQLNARAELPSRLARLGMVATLTLAACWILFIFFSPEGTVKGRFEDANDIYQAGLAFHQGGDPYRSIDYRNWPLVAALASPLALLPTWIALRLFAIVGTGGALFGVWLLWHRLYDEGVASSARWFALVALGPPTLVLFYLGQFSGLCFTAYACGLSLVNRRPIVGGLVFAFGAAKPQLLPLALPALLGAPRIAIVAFFFGVMSWPVGSLLVAGPRRLQEFVTRLYAVHDSPIGLVTVPLSALLPLTGTPHLVVQLSLFTLLSSFLVLIGLRSIVGKKPLSPTAVDVCTALALAGLPYALISDTLFMAPAMLRLGKRPISLSRWILLAWWLLPVLAASLANIGGGGILAILPPTAAIVLLRLAIPTSRIEGAVNA